MNSLCQKCEHWSHGLSLDGFEGYCHLREQQVHFEKRRDEPRARLDRKTRDSEWECEAFVEIEPDWAHA